MTVLSLFDLLNRDRSVSGDAASLHLAHLADKLVASTLTDLERLRDYEQEVFAPAVSNPALELELLRSVWNLYEQWTVEAEQVLERGRALDRSGSRVDGLNRLNAAIGRVQARLSVKPEQIAKAMGQIAQGQFVPARELRDELNARLRA